MTVYCPKCGYEAISEYKMNSSLILTTRVDYFCLDCEIKFDFDITPFHTMEPNELQQNGICCECLEIINECECEENEHHLD